MALALRAAGWRVSLIDQAPAVMRRASLRNEGKIHLGFTYAKDSSLSTGRLMLRSALSFAPLIDRWIPDGLDWERIRARPFTYLLMRDSALEPEALYSYYERLELEYRALREPWQHYLDTRPDSLWSKAPLPPEVSRAAVAAAVETAEMPLDLVELRRQLARAVGESAVSCQFGRRVEAVRRRAHGFSVAGVEGGGESWRLAADAVVNCLWEGRLKIDAEMGMAPQQPWTYRLKYRVLGRLPRALADLPSLTLVLGSYGDIVPLSGGSYISWYPECRRGWSNDLEVPQSWHRACAGEVDPTEAREVSSRVYEALEPITPGIAATSTVAVDAGIVVAWGDTDIDHPDSGFHQRSAVGVAADDGYFSIDTGKLSCGPLFAAELAARI